MKRTRNVYFYSMFFIILNAKKCTHDSNIKTRAKINTRKYLNVWREIKKNKSYFD